MTDQDVLRKALNEIDGLRYRWGWVCGIMAAISQAAWIALAIGAERASEKQLILLATFALACTVFGGVFMLALLVYRMTHKVLQAIELSGRRA
jgi:hypothetical protein